MKKWKKIITAIMVAALAAAPLAGCGNTAPDASSASSEEKTDAGDGKEDLSGKWLMVRYASGDLIIEYDRLGEAGMNENTYLDIAADGSGTLSMMGSPMEVQLHDGKVSVQGVDIYTYCFPEPDVIEVDMAGSVYTLAKEGSDALTAYQGVTTESSDNLYADQATDDYTYTPMENETEFKFDGGTLYYTVMDGKACVTWITPTTKDLYIPEEVDGYEVAYVQKIGGNVENIYYPYGIVEIDREIGPVKGVKTITFGYGDKEPKLEYIHQGLEYGEDLETIIFNDSINDIGYTASTFDDPIQYPKLNKVVNPPERWAKGIAYHEKLLSILESHDPNDFIEGQSEKVTDLANEVTKDAKTDEEKLYAISRWIVDNIQYDISYNIHNYSNEYLPENNPDKIIDGRVCVCSGYSHLTKAMCNAVGIPAVYVVGDFGRIKHAWNAIYINGKWGIYDNTENDTGFNTDMTLFRDMDEYVAAQKENEMTYEKYLANEELQEAYSWDELQEIMKEDKAEDDFDHYHPYYDCNIVIIGADHIPEKIGGEKFLDGTELDEFE
ncbi:MAG: transglutaminase domain-containing protein [Lachnospiraceae bacterium]|nr:transglutaminase domain-containing protein [Lachnospiraceae bacterium]